ncbi:MAG: nitrilase-related carbon-nitrogen hydrolase [Planctomycetota bacterium]
MAGTTQGSINPFVRFLARYRRAYGLVVLVPFLIMARPAWWSLAVGIPIMAFGAAFRMWASGYIHKDNKLATFGPYSVVRNPLYFGSYVLGAGCLVAGNALWVLLFYLITFPVVYIALILTEEVRLHKLFGYAYEEYSASVPRLFPDPFRYHPGRDQWSIDLAVRDHRETVTLLAAGTVILVLLAMLLLRREFTPSTPAPMPAATVTDPAGDRPVPTRETTARVAAIQFVSAFGKPAENRRGLEKLIRQAAGGGARIVVLPEAAISGYMTHDLRQSWQVGDRSASPGVYGITPASVAETVPGPSTDAFGALARELNLYLTVPLIETDPKTGRYFNTLVLVGPAGTILAHYRKLHPWPFAECGWAVEGDRGLAYVDTPYGRLGLLICFDMNFEPANLAAAGVDMVLYAIAWVDKKDGTWFTRELPRIAGANHMHIIAANWSVPEEPVWAGYGQTRIIDRTGRIAAAAGADTGNAVVMTDLDVTPVKP